MFQSRHVVFQWYNSCSDFSLQEEQPGNHTGRDFGRGPESLGKKQEVVECDFLFVCGILTMYFHTYEYI